jgi:hypothetical protein
MAKKIICITIDKSLLKDIDKIRGYIPRATFINNILSWSLNLQSADQLTKKDNWRGNID